MAIRMPVRPLPLERINRRGGLERPDPRAPRSSTLVALLLACAVLIVLDLTSPALTPLRRLAGEVYGPLESAATTVARPVTSIPDWFQGQGELREQVAQLQAENDALRQQIETAGYDRNKLAQYERLTGVAERIGYAVVPARVIGHGASQSFSAGFPRRSSTATSTAACGSRRSSSWPRSRA